MTEMRIVGMGFVGIPLAVAFDDAGHDVVGFDIDEERIRELRRGNDPTGEVEDSVLRKTGVEFTTDPTAIGGFDYAIITVPTPIDDWQRPKLDMIAAAGRTVGDQLQPGGTVVLESTVYPGGTREILVPALESASGLETGRDYGVGYSPERIAPGTADSYSLRNTSKLVSGDDEKTLSELVALYESIIEASVHPVPTIETAEAAKCLENVQRDVNIALINEFVIGSRKLDIDLDPWAVLDAAGTKPAFHDYRPGIVGGHCIPVDPHLLAKRFVRNGFYPSLIESARQTNESLPRHIAEQVAKNVPQTGTVAQADGFGVEGLSDRTVADGKVDGFRTLVLGFAYKANVSDARNNALGTLIDELDSYGASVDGCDPLVDDNYLATEFGVHPVDDPDFAVYDAVIVTTLHDEFREYNLNNHDAADGSPYVVDLTGHFRQSADTLSTESNVS